MQTPASLLEDPPFTGCPPDELVRLFHGGELPEADFESIAEHLSECERCFSSAERLQQELDRDPLLEALRRSFADDITMDEAGDQLALTAGSFRPNMFEPQPLELNPFLFQREIGGYELLSTIGRGGMGVVYKARQKRLNRLVALKTILSGAYASPAALERFGAEGEAVARLKHPRVVQIFEFGEHEGVPYFSMELTDGGTLKDLLAKGPLPPRRAVELAIELADAIHYAHSQNVVHRDLKPGNILLDQQGSPKITDFGLAKLLDMDTAHTCTGTIMGTPAYMAPEQSLESRRPTDGRTDIYALGAILYEMLTGTPPFSARSRNDVLREVRKSQPTPPSERNAHVPRALEQICLKCLEKSPDRRYASAKALADDLNAWLAGKPCAAAAGEWRRQARRFLKTYGITMAAVAFAAVAFAAIITHDPDRSLRPIEAQLAGRHAVTLAGKNGAPEWHRWRVGGDSASLATGFDGMVTLKAPDVALLELVKIPCAPPYRFSVEVAQENGANLNGHVGIFCCAQDHPTYLGDGHAFAALTFSDIFSAARFGKNAGDKIKVIDAASFNCQLFARKDGFGECALDLAHVTMPQIVAAGAERGPFRELQIEVRETGFRFSIDGKVFQDLSKKEIAEKIVLYNEMNKKVNATMPPGSPLIQASWPTNMDGSLGIYAVRAIVTYRKARVTPL